MRVLISGSGIAGLTLAYWLHQYGHTPLVIEQAEAIRRGGYAFDFYGTGYDVAERMGLISTLQQQQIRLDAISYMGASGKPYATLNTTLMRKVMHDRYMSLMHWTLEEALYNTIVNDVEVRYGRSLTAVKSSPEEVSVTFNDGTTEAYDLLVGADGVHSNTRHLVFRAEKHFQHYLGYTFASYPLPDHYGIGRNWNNYIEPGRLASAYCSNNDGEIITFLIWKTANQDYIPREQRLAHLHQVFAGMGWITSRLLDDVSDSTAIFMDTVTQIHMPTWHSGRVVLVGDACGCPTLISGQGASMAMGGAYLLAKALHETFNYEDAFLRYEQQVRPHVEKRQKKTQDSAKRFDSNSLLGLCIQQLMMRILLRDSFIRLLRQHFGGESIL
ncbi:FAD-dependent monooxygenase [Ktedonobacteria bacterium brp13]|nr:FAD-dependent monooxygenase [Ktedonobacteria bacterium brp13]